MGRSIRVYNPSAALCKELQNLLSRNGLSLHPHPDCISLLREEENHIVAMGCRVGNVLQDIVVHPACRGEDLAAAIISDLLAEAHQQGIQHLFLFTQVRNQKVFEALGFYVVAATDEVLMLENCPNGLHKFLKEIPVSTSGQAGCIVAHANPFTNGHLALVEAAVGCCPEVYLFILSDGTGPFSAQQRLSMAQLATASLPGVQVVSSGDYLISHTTFPDYFYPDLVVGRQANCMLDVTLFAEHIAPALGIVTRFVGEEPLSAVTADYNRALANFLPSAGIALQVLPRKTYNGLPISASRVRVALTKGDWAGAAQLTPPCCHPYLRAYLNA